MNIGVEKGFGQVREGYEGEKLYHYGGPSPRFCTKYMMVTIPATPKCIASILLRMENKPNPSSRQQMEYQGVIEEG
jgi:hypothetical protein